MSTKLNEKQLIAIHLLASGVKASIIANQLGMREETLSRWRQIDEFKEDKQIAFTNNINVFLKAVDLIIANRIDDTLSNQKDKLIFTRDIFNEN